MNKEDSKGLAASLSISASEYLDTEEALQAYEEICQPWAPVDKWLRPRLNLVETALELALKSILASYRRSEKELRKFGHDIEKLAAELEKIADDAQIKALCSQVPNRFDNSDLHKGRDNIYVRVQGRVKIEALRSKAKFVKQIVNMASMRARNMSRRHKDSM